ncbi:MAG TPA: FHA domain-containing protein [Kofleriaceae bacterium]
MADAPRTRPTDPPDQRRTICWFRAIAKGVSSANAERIAIGSHPSNDLVIEDDTVSRFHCEL